MEVDKSKNISDMTLDDMIKKDKRGGRGGLRGGRGGRADRGGRPSGRGGRGGRDKAGVRDKDRQGGRPRFDEKDFKNKDRNDLFRAKRTGGDFKDKRGGRNRD